MPYRKFTELSFCQLEAFFSEMKTGFSVGRSHGTFSGGRVCYEKMFRDALDDRARTFFHDISFGVKIAKLLACYVRLAEAFYELHSHAQEKLYGQVTTTRHKDFKTFHDVKSSHIFNLQSCGRALLSSLT